MSRYSKNTTSNLIPCLRYRDVPAALKWLCQVFDFEQQRVIEDAQVGVIHAQLSFGSGMLMVGPVADSEYGRQVKQPDEVGGLSTQSIYVIVNSADALYTKAKAAGVPAGNHGGQRPHRFALAASRPAFRRTAPAHHEQRSSLVGHRARCWFAGHRLCTTGLGSLRIGRQCKPTSRSENPRSPGSLRTLSAAQLCSRAPLVAS